MKFKFTKVLQKVKEIQTSIFNFLVAEIFQISYQYKKLNPCEHVCWQIYPDESHSLSGVKKHLYRSMANFLDDCFRKQVPPDLKAGLRNGGAFLDP